jgi:hypothetical protein
MYTADVIAHHGVLDERVLFIQHAFLASGYGDQGAGSYGSTVGARCTNPLFRNIPKTERLRYETLLTG